MSETETYQEMIRGLMPKSISPEKVSNCVRAWEEYMQFIRLDDEAAKEEFRAIVRARFSAGIISIAAPSFKELI